jgi:hypothetical protein
MKKILTLTTCILLAVFNSSGQDTVKPVTHKNQNDLLNELYISYGIASVLAITSGNTTYSQSSTGNFIIGYTRTITRVIGVGFQASFVTVTQNSKSSTGEHWSQYDTYLQALARVQFNYLRKPVFSMYSGVAIGVTVDYRRETSESEATTSYQQFFPAAQLTLLGFRVGRSAAFCGEFGVGTLSILSLGFSYKFGQ